MWKQRFERALLITLGILVVAGAVLLGGVHPPVQLFLSAAALVLLLTTVGWRFYKRGTFTVGAPFWLLLLLVGVCLAQLAWLPEGLHRVLQPRGAALAAYSTEGLGPLWHRCLSLDPPGTILECCKLLGFAALAATAALLVRDGPRALLLFWTLSVAGMVVAAVAAVQVLSGSKAIFGIYRPEVGGRFLTPFVNENHAGGFYAALAFLHLGLALQVREPRRRWSMIALTALPALLVIASASRGAIAAMVLGGLGMLVLYWRVGKLNRRQLGYGIAITLILGTVALPASETVRREFGSKTTVETVAEDAKIKIWADALPMARDYPLTGIGRGAFRSVFPSYYRVSSGLRVTFSHAENLGVQLLVELGPLVFGVLLLLLVVLGVRYFRQVSFTEVAAIALLPIAVLGAQNLVDFNLEFPGTGFLLVVLLGALAGLHGGRTRRVQTRRRRLVGAAGWLAFVLASGLALATLGPAGVRFDLRTEGKKLQADINRGDRPAQTLAATREAIRRHPADFYLHHLAGVAALSVVGELPLRHFNRALYLNPRSGATRWQVGRALWQLGLPRQALVHYLEALERGIPARGNLAGELHRLLVGLWEARAANRSRSEASGCAAAVSLVGQLPAVSCLLADRQAARRQARAFGVVARVDRLAVAAIAQRIKELNQHDLALDVYEQMLVQEPRNLEVLEALARLSHAAGDPIMALHWTEALLQVEPAVWAYQLLGRIRREVGHRKVAERIADRALARFPGDPKLVALKAELLVDRGELQSAQSMILEQTVGKSLEMQDELLLLTVRLRIEQQGKNALRQERLKLRIQQLQRLLKAGFRGQNIGRE